jgi:hypothetical protein
MSPTETTEESVRQQRHDTLSAVVRTLLDDLRDGAGDKDRRRQVEEWLRTLADKYPDFSIEAGLRDYYLAESDRLKADFERTEELSEKLQLGRSIESFLDRAAEYDRRARER